MFIQNRDESRAYFYNVWKKQKNKLPLELEEGVISDVISEHPEYHYYLDSKDDDRSTLTMSMFNNLNKIPKEIQECLNQYIQAYTSETFDTEEEVFEYMKKHMEHSLHGNPNNKKDIGLMGEVMQAFEGISMTEEKLKKLEKPNF